MTINSDTGIGPPGYFSQYYSDRNWKSYTDLLALVVRYSRPGPILDLGAGCGYFLEAATRWGLSCVGLEGSTEAVEMARKRMASLDIRRHNLSDIFPFQTNSFQTVVLNQVIEHLEPAVVRHTLHEANRVLRSGGMILITSPSCYNKVELKADSTHINLTSPSQLHAAISEAGFENIAPFDSPLKLLGDNWLGIRMMLIIFKLVNLDSISATANSFAFKISTTRVSN